MRHQPTPTYPRLSRSEETTGATNPRPHRRNHLAPVLASVALTGCADVAIWGNVFSMLLTLAIFVGTLSLSREGGHGEP